MITLSCACSLFHVYVIKYKMKPVLYYKQKKTVKQFYTT